MESSNELWTVPENLSLTLNKIHHTTLQFFRQKQCSDVLQLKVIINPKFLQYIALLRRPKISNKHYTQGNKIYFASFQSLNSTY